jgi:GNAT superfamily N-acetyltransferase
MSLGFGRPPRPAGRHRVAAGRRALPAMHGMLIIRPAGPMTSARCTSCSGRRCARARSLGADYYTSAQVEAAARYVCVPDRELIEDGTYLVAELDGRLVGCGGWSLRRKAYAGPAQSRSDAERLDPATEPTRIRAMFTAPDLARQGVGRAILRAAEDAARAVGFCRARFGATLSGEAFYRRSGHVEIGRELAPLPDGTAIEVILMQKNLAGCPGGAR